MPLPGIVGKSILRVNKHHCRLRVKSYDNLLFIRVGALYYLRCVPGVGALYVRRRPRVRIEAPQSGGGQERGMRSGTVPTPLTVGFGAACQVAQQEMEVGSDLHCTIPTV